MAMSSLQQRMLDGAPKLSNTDAMKRDGGSFEDCFAAGLGLASTNNRSTIISADLAQRTDRRNREVKEEAALERRVADVVQSAKSSACCSDDNLDDLPKAMHPEATADSTLGKERDDNFVQFRDGSKLGVNDTGGFLSSLVSNQKSDKTVSHKSRALKSQLKKEKKLTVSGLGRPARRHAQQGKQQPKRSLGRKVAAKKSRKSKF